MVLGSVVSAYGTPRAAFVLATIAGALAVLFAIINSAVILIRDKRRRNPSISQMKNAAELQALRQITSEN